MNIADIIAALTSGQDPNKAVIAGYGAVPSGETAPQIQSTPAQANVPARAGILPPVPPPDPGVPTGTPTPVTNPMPAPSQPKAMQSPPDLANMYIQLMKQNQNAQQLDSGLSLIAAGLSNSPANRAALISASGHGGTGGMSLSASDLINFQKQEQANRDRMIMQGALPALMKQYKMTPAQITALQASGQLPEVLKHYSTENLGSAVDANTGQTHLFTPRDGKVIATIGGEKEDPTQIVTTAEGQQPMNLRTGELVGKPSTVPPIADQAEVNAINTARTAAGQPADMTIEKLIKLKQSPGVQVNVSPTGAVFPKAPEGQDYERNPDNTVKIGPDGHPTLYTISGSTTEAEQKAAAKKLSDADAKEAMAKVQAAFGASNVGMAIDTALKHIDTPGVVGLGSNWARAFPSPGGLPTDKFDAAMKTVGSNITIDTLARMRQASPTGGALGNVSDFEDKMLQSVIAPLSTAQDAATMKQSLFRVKAAMELLAADDFGKKTDPANAPKRFQEALKNRIDELAIEYANRTSKVKVTREK